MTLLQLCLLLSSVVVSAAPNTVTPTQLLESLSVPPHYIKTLGSIESVDTLAKLTDSSLRWDFGINDAKLRRRLLVSFGAAPPDSREQGQYVVVAVTMDGVVRGIDGMTGASLWNKTLPEPMVQSSVPEDALIPSLPGEDHRLFTYESTAGMQVLELQKEQRVHPSKSVALGHDAHLVLTDVQPVQLLALDPRTGREPSTHGPSLLLAMQRKSVHVMEPSRWSVQLNASVAQVSAAATPQHAAAAAQHAGLLAPVLMAAKGVLVSLHPVTGTALWQMALEGMPLSVLNYDLKQSQVQGSLSLENDLVILCRGGQGVSECDGLMIDELHRHLIPSVAKTLSSDVERVFVMQAPGNGLVAVPNPPVMIVDTPGQMLRLPSTSGFPARPALSAPQIRALDTSVVSSKMVLRSELARSGMTQGRIPTKWGGSKALETATAAELKWALLKKVRRDSASKLAEMLSGVQESKVPGRDIDCGAACFPRTRGDCIAHHSRCQQESSDGAGLAQGVSRSVGVALEQPGASHLGLHWLQPSLQPQHTTSVPALAAPESIEPGKPDLETWVATDSPGVAMIFLLAFGVLAVTAGLYAGSKLRGRTSSRKRRKHRRSSTAPEEPAVPHPAVPQAGAATADSEAKVPPARECVVCADEDAVFCLYPCGHQCVCGGCGEMLQEGGHVCPMCRSVIQDTVRVWTT